MVLLLRLLVVASEGRFLQRPAVGRIVAFCVLHLFVVFDFMTLFNVKGWKIFAHSKATIIHTYTYAHIIWLYLIYHFDFFLLPCLKSGSRRQDYALHRPLRPKYELSDEEISPCWRVWSLLVFIGYNPLWPWEPTSLIFGGYDQKPSFFMVLGSKGTGWFRWYRWWFCFFLTTGAKASFSSRRPSSFL